LHLNSECAQTDGRKKESHDILPVHSVHLADIANNNQNPVKQAQAQGVLEAKPPKQRIYPLSPNTTDLALPNFPYMSGWSNSVIKLFLNN